MSNQMLIYSTQNTFVVPCLHVALLPIYGTVLSLFIYNTDHDSFHQCSVHTSHGTIGPYHRPPRCRKLSMNWAYGPSGRIETVARLWSLIVITWYLLYAVFFWDDPEYFCSALPTKVIGNVTVGSPPIFYSVFHCSCVLSSIVWNIQRRIMACPWNVGKWHHSISLPL